jgi:hypothetical protein
MEHQAHLWRLDGAAIKGEMHEGWGQDGGTAKDRLRDPERTLVDLCRIEPQLRKLHDTLEAISFAVTR